ncbi:MAG: metal transporter [Chloroflexi bacterium]|nr:metal transporter [Chloroflexota bacterium]
MPAATKTRASIPGWVSALLPLAALGLLAVAFSITNPLAVFESNLPVAEQINVERIALEPGRMIVSVVNGGPEAVTIAQVEVDAAFWKFTISPSPLLPRLGRATIALDYPWVKGEPHVVKIVTATGTTFEGTVAVAAVTPRPGLREFGTYGLLGVYVGIIPVILGLLWFPAMRQLGRRGLGFILALTVGMLVFLLIDTMLEAFEVAGKLPGVFQGAPLALFAALLSWLAIAAVSSRRGGTSSDPVANRLWVATMIALGIGLHNLGEGLAIGAAFALGQAALGSFLVVGFTLHNVTEGIGIAAPVTRDQPSLWRFAGLALLAGAPAIGGAWIGGFAYSPLLAVLFLGIGAGAIWQVIVEVGNLLRRDAERDGLPLISWLNVAGLLVGIGAMYATAFLVKF